MKRTDHQLFRRDFPKLPWSWWNTFEMALALRAASTPLSYYPHAGQAWQKIRRMEPTQLKALVAEAAGDCTYRWYRDNLDHGKVRVF